MSGITILSDNPALEHTFVDLYGKTLPVRRTWSDQWGDPTEIAMDVCAADPELVVLGSDVDPERARGVVPEIDRRFPSTTILRLVLAVDTDESMALLRLGARDVLVEAGPTDEFRAALDPVIDVARDRHRQTAGDTTQLRRRIITVVSPKGGTGKTTVATNLAVGLARRMPKKVLLVDLDVQFGDCAAALGVQPEYSLTDAIAAAGHERSALKVFLASHPSGLALLSPPEDLVAADDVDPDEIKVTLAALAEEFPFVVVDTASGIDPMATAAMEQATDLLVVSTTDVPSIRAVRRQLEALDQIGYVAQRRTFVLNRANAKVGLSVGEVEAAVGLKASFEIPSTRLIPLSTNEGIAVLDRDRAGNVATRFEDIVHHFAPDTGTGGRWFRRGQRKER